MTRIYTTATPRDLEMKVCEPFDLSYCLSFTQNLQVKVLQASVQQSIEISETTTFLQRFQRLFLEGINRRALSTFCFHFHSLAHTTFPTVVGCGMQAFQQLCGFNTLMYYSATLFQEIGFNQPTAVSLIVSGTNFIFTLVALKWIDQIGRRKIMLWSAPGMIFGLTLASIAFHCGYNSMVHDGFEINSFFLDMTRKTGGVLVENTAYPDSWADIVLLSMIIFVASYATGIGNVPWQQGELFSLDVRGLGTSIATATNWAANLLINSTYLSLMAKITPAGVYTLMIYVFSKHSHPVLRCLWILCRSLPPRMALCDILLP